MLSSQTFLLCRAESGDFTQNYQSQGDHMKKCQWADREHAKNEFLPEHFDSWLNHVYWLTCVSNMKKKCVCKIRNQALFLVWRGLPRHLYFLCVCVFVWEKEWEISPLVLSLCSVEKCKPGRIRKPERNPITNVWSACLHTHSHTLTHTHTYAHPYTRTHKHTHVVSYQHSQVM